MESNSSKSSGGWGPYRYTTKFAKDKQGRPITVRIHSDGTLDKQDSSAAHAQ